MLYLVDNWIIFTKAIYLVEICYPSFINILAFIRYTINGHLLVNLIK